MTAVLLESYADWVIQEVRSALSEPGTTVGVVRAGSEVRRAASVGSPDLVILDLQIGNMGGMAACIDLRLEIDAGRVSPVPVLMLLDRSADVFLAQQAGAEVWIVKPLDAFRLKMASVKLLSGENMRDEVADTPEVAGKSIELDPLVNSDDASDDSGDQSSDDDPAKAL